MCVRALLARGKVLRKLCTRFFFDGFSDFLRDFFRNYIFGF